MLVGSRILNGALVLLVAVGLWLAVALIPVEWSLSPSQREGAVFRLGPVSADVAAGQTFASTEPFDLLVVPVKIGGPFGSAVVMYVRVHAGGPDNALIARSAPVAAVSTRRAFEMVVFRLAEPIAAGRPYYFEIEVPRDTPWPVFLAATRLDKASSGRLFLGGASGFEDQDLVYQLLSRQSLLGRLPRLWTAHQGSVVVGIGLLAMLHLVSYAAVHTVPVDVRRRLPHPLALGLAAPAVLAAAYFALLFFVL